MGSGGQGLLTPIPVVSLLFPVALLGVLEGQAPWIWDAPLGSVGNVWAAVWDMGSTVDASALAMNCDSPGSETCGLGHVPPNLSPLLEGRTP